MESVGVAEDIKFARRGAGRAAMFSHHPPMAEEASNAAAFGDRWAQSASLLTRHHLRCARMGKVPVRFQPVASSEPFIVPPLQVTSFITTKELHFSEPSLDKAKAQAGLWSGSTMHNVHVPVGTLRPSSRLPGVGGGFEDRFETTAGATLGSTARAVMAGHAERRQPITQDGAKEGGQRAQVGRKPKGEFSAAPDAKAWRAPLRTK